MGSAGIFQPSKLLIGILFSKEQLLSDLERILLEHFGAIDYKSPILPFNYTSYYNSEMGNNIFKLFYSFEYLVSPEKLTDIKLKTNEIESLFTDTANRSINLDPGILNLSRLILASTKDNAHRISLSKGIYGEVTLLYRKGDYDYLPWTYSDFKSDDYKKILLKIRQLYKEQLKQIS